MQILTGFKVCDDRVEEDFILQLITPCNMVKESSFVGEEVGWFPLKAGRYVFENFQSLYDVLYCGIEVEFNTFKYGCTVHVRVVDPNHYCLRRF